MAVFKLTRQVVALFKADDLIEAGAIADGLVGLDDLAYFIEQGDGIGADTQIGLIELPADKVEGELVAVGNDGTFFDSEDNADGGD